jgi:hypothetical protein
MKLKLIEYNLLNGFCNEEKPYILQKDRLTAVAKVLQKENPDILVLTEGFFWPFAKRDSLKDYKRLFENIYRSYAPAPNQFRWAPIVLSRFPIEFTDFSEFHKTFIRTQINIKNKAISLDVLHPYPELSEQEKADLLYKALQNRSSPYILSGDLNALSPQDNFDKKRLIEGYRQFMKDRAENKVNDMLSHKSVSRILQEGLNDTYLSKNSPGGYTVPTDLRSKSKDSSGRMDYIFCSKDFNVLDSGIIKNKLTEMASDHYPIYSILELK